MGSFLLGMVHGFGQEVMDQRREKAELYKQQQKIEQEAAAKRNTEEIKAAAKRQEKLEEHAANMESTKGNLRPYVLNSLRSYGISPSDLVEASESFFKDSSGFIYDAKGNRNADITSQNLGDILKRSVGSWVNSKGKGFLPTSEDSSQTPKEKTTGAIYSGFPASVESPSLTEKERIAANIKEFHPNISTDILNIFANNNKHNDYMSLDAISAAGIDPDIVPKSYMRDGKALVLLETGNKTDGSSFTRLRIPGTGVVKEMDIPRNLSIDERGDLKDKVNASLKAAQNATSQIRNILTDPNISMKVGIQGKFFSSLSEAAQAVPGLVSALDDIADIDLQAYDASVQELLQQSNVNVESFLNNLKQNFPGTRMSQYLLDRAKEKAVEVNDPTATIGKLLKAADFIQESNMLLAGEALYSLGQDMYRAESEDFRTQKIRKAMHDIYMEMYTRTSDNKRVSYTKKQEEALEAQITDLVDYNYRVIQKQHRSFFGGN